MPNITYQDALRILAAQGLERLPAIKAIYSKREFTGEEVAFALAAFASVAQFAPALGSAWYVIEWHGDMIESYLDSDLAHEILKYLPRPTSPNQIWTGNDYVAWRAARVLQIEPLPPIGQRISVEPECVSNIEWCLLPLASLEEYDEIADSVAQAFCERTTFGESEIHFARDSVGSHMPGSPLTVCCLHVLASSLCHEEYADIAEKVSRPCCVLARSIWEFVRRKFEGGTQP